MLIAEALQALHEGSYASGTTRNGRATMYARCARAGFLGGHSVHEHDCSMM